MTRLVWECYRRICDFLCLRNAEALINYVSGLLSDFPMPKQQTDMVQSAVQIYSEVPSSSIQRQALFAPLAQHFTMKQLHNITQDHVSEN